MKQYTAPKDARVGHIHLKVSNLDAALGFYQDLLGFKVTQRIGDQVAFLAAGNYHHHIALNTWHSKNYPKASIQGVGLYHTAFLYPSRKDFAIIVKRLIDHQYPLEGAADHGVSEALYLSDPDGNGVEVYCDKPLEDWPFDKDNNLAMYTKYLDLQKLLREELGEFN